MKSYYAVIVKVDGVIQNVFLSTSKKKAEKKRVWIINEVSEQIIYECAIMDNRNNSENVLSLRLSNSSVSIHKAVTL